MQCLYPTSHCQFIAFEHHRELWEPASVRVNTSVQLVHALLGTMCGSVHSRLETRTMESSMPASSSVATIYDCATKILACICAPATHFFADGKYECERVC